MSRLNLNFTRFRRASGFGFSGRTGLYCVGLLEGLRGPLNKGGVPTMRVVPAIDAAEDGQARFGVRIKAVFREALDFERREEPLIYGVVIGIAARSDRRLLTEQLVALSERIGAKLRALIGVMEHVGMTALRRGHVQGVQHEAGVQRVAHASAHDRSTEDIKHDGEVQKARLGYSAK